MKPELRLMVLEGLSKRAALGDLLNAGFRKLAVSTITGYVPDYTQSAPEKLDRNAKARSLYRDYFRPFKFTADLGGYGPSPASDLDQLTFRLTHLTNEKPNERVSVDDLRREGVIPPTSEVRFLDEPLRGYYDQYDRSIGLGTNRLGLVSRSMAAHEAGHERQDRPGGLLTPDLRNSPVLSQPLVSKNSISPEVSPHAMYTGRDGRPSRVALESDAWDKSTGPYDLALRQLAVETYKQDWINKYRSGYATYVDENWAKPSGVKGSGASRTLSHAEWSTAKRYIRSHTPGQAVEHLKRLSEPKTDFGYRTGPVK